MQWLKRRRKAGLYPCVQPAWGASDSCFGQCVTGFSQLGIPQLQLMCDQSSSMAGTWGCGVWKILGCGPEGDYCTRKCPKIVSFSKILMPKSIMLSHSHKWMWILSTGIKRGWGGEIEISPFWPYWSFRLLLSCGFFPFLLLLVSCSVLREGRALASIAPVFWVNRSTAVDSGPQAPQSVEAAFK